MRSVFSFLVIVKMEALQRHQDEVERLGLLDPNEREIYLENLDLKHLERYGFVRVRSQDVYLLLAHKMTGGVTDEGVAAENMSEWMIPKWGIGRLYNCMITINAEMEVKPYQLQIRQLIQHHGFAMEAGNKMVADVLLKIIESMRQNEGDQFLIEAYELTEALDEIPATITVETANSICKILKMIFK